VVIIAVEQCLIAGVGWLEGLPLCLLDTLTHMLNASARCKLVALDEHTHRQAGRQPVRTTSHSEPFAMRMIKMYTRLPLRWVINLVLCL
jgi:hypothetical protein